MDFPRNLAPLQHEEPKIKHSIDPYKERKDRTHSSGAVRTLYVSDAGTAYQYVKSYSCVGFYSLLI
jgi:hypothetical protein